MFVVLVATIYLFLGVKCVNFQEVEEGGGVVLFANIICKLMQ